MIWKALTSPLGKGLALVGLSILAVLAFRAWLAAHDAAISAKARSGYVALTVLEAANARAAEVERQRTAATTALENYRKRAVEAKTAEDEANARLEAAIAADGPGECSWTDDDLRWLRENRSGG